MIATAAFAMLLGALASSTTGALAQGRCDQCDLPPGCRGNGNTQGQGNGRADRPQCQRIDVTIEADLDYGRLVLVGDGVGSVLIDLESGTKITSGGIDDLGGFALAGRATIVGAPNQLVTLSLPRRVTMSDPAGGQAELRDFATDLPPLVRLDGNGRLQFQFTARLVTSAQTARGGTLRARFPIDVQYD